MVIKVILGLFVILGMSKFLDSGCSRHMMGDASMFIKFDEKENGHVMYGDNRRGKSLGEGVVKNPSIITIEGMLLVKMVKYKGYSIT